jgi:hypothetical protein
LPKKQAEVATQHDEQTLEKLAAVGGRLPSEPVEGFLEVFLAVLLLLHPASIAVLNRISRL